MDQQVVDQLKQAVHKLEYLHNVENLLEKISGQLDSINKNTQHSAQLMEQILNLSQQAAQAASQPGGNNTVVN